MTAVAGKVIVCPDVPVVPKMVNSPVPAVAVAERTTSELGTTFTHVPGVPAVVQNQIVAVWSMTMSPTANVPDTGGPEVVVPTRRELEAVAPVRPVILRSGTTTSPVNVAPESGASWLSKLASTVCAIW